MGQSYCATAKQNPGRKAWLVEFRHPLRIDTNGKSGRKTRKGLGTSDPDRARLLVDQLNALLSNDGLWSIGARADAEKLYEPEVIEIFYSEIEPKASDARPLRDKLLPFPARNEGFAKVVMLGVPGAGKTTLVRQLIGTHPTREAFPPTSLNRTTTFPTEIVLRPGDFEAVATFISETEARFELEECVSSAIQDATTGDRHTVARTLLEKSDMRFRLKHLFGDLNQQVDDIDPYADEEEGDTNFEVDGEDPISDSERKANVLVIESYVDQIFNIYEQAKALVEAEYGPLDVMNPADRATALDKFQEIAESSEEFRNLVSEILDDIREKFNEIVVQGRFEKTVTGWPKSWITKVRPDQRAAFLASLRTFSSTNFKYWGRLFTPVVNGLRVQGPFKPNWSSEDLRLILIDTEGLNHKADSTADMSEQMISILHEADVILLVDSAKSGLTNFAAGKALETIANTGMTQRLAMVFTHMDMASQTGLSGARLRDQVFSGLRNVVDNQLSKSVSSEVARFMIDRLNSHTYYVGRIEKAEAKGAELELSRLLSHLIALQPEADTPVAVPVYEHSFLIMALQEATRDFRRQWQGILGLTSDSEHKPKPWQTIKALSRRYAENWGDNFELRPTANLRSALETAVSRYLEGPIDWEGSPTPEQKREIIEQLKKAVTKKLPEVSRIRLREKSQPSWHEAWIPRGLGSTSTRRSLIEGIFQRQVPIPNARGDLTVIDFMKEIEEIVETSLEDLQKQVQAE